MIGNRLIARIACALFLASGGCAHRPPPALHSTHLIVTNTATEGVRPLIRAKVGGHQITLLVDTGTFRSLLPLGFARAHNLVNHARSTGDYLIDANGKAIPIQLLSDVPTQFEGETTPGWLDFMISPSGSTDEGILAPQDIVRPGFALVIDLENEELRHEPEEDALKRLRAEGSAPVLDLDFHRCIEEGFFDRGHRIVSVSINGVSADMLVDTGSSHTTLSRNNPAIGSMTAVQGSRGATAAVASVGQALLVEDVPIVFSETTFVLPVIVQPASSSCWKGALGADLLRHCTLVWGRSKLWASCRTPAKAK
jgi:hypothetical protein